MKVDGKPVLACQTKVEKDCQVEIPGKKKKGKILERRIFQKGEFPAGMQVKNSVAGEAGDWEKKVRVGAAAGGVYENLRN